MKSMKSMKKHKFRVAAVLGAMLVPALALAQQTPSSGDATAARLDALFVQVEAQKAEIANLKASIAQSAPTAQASGIAASDKKNTVKIGTNAEVTLYGRIMAQAENVQVTNSANAPDNLTKNRIAAHNSNIGFKGNLDVGGGNALFFQIEQRAPIDGSASNGFADRNSGVGFKGPWGTMLVGKWNTPYKDQTIKVDPFNETTIASNTFVMGQVSQLGEDDIFHARQRNAIQYWTPKVNGFSGKIHLTANEGKTTTTNPYNMSLALDYDQGPLFAFAGHETHKDSGDLTAGATGSDKGAHVGGGYRFTGGTTVTMIWEKLSFHADALGATAAADMSRNAWFLGASHKFNQVVLRGGYGQAGDQTGTNTMAGGNTQTGAKGFYLGVGYALNGFKVLDKTEIFAQYVSLKNDKNASYILTNNDAGNGLDMAKAGPTRSAGANYSGVMIGVMSYF